jgi:hypothetical protein
MSNQRISRDFADANTTPEDRARGKFLARPLKIERNRHFGEPIPLSDPSLDDTDPANADDLRTATGIFNGIIWTVAIIGGGIGLWWLAAHMSLVLAWVER